MHRLPDGDQIQNLNSQSEPHFPTHQSSLGSSLDPARPVPRVLCKCGSPCPLWGSRIDGSGGAPVLSSAGTIVPGPSFPSRRSKEEAYVSVLSPPGKGKGGALRAAFWERVVFWVPGARHSLASRLRLLTFVPEPKRSLRRTAQEDSCQDVYRRAD